MESVINEVEINGKAYVLKENVKTKEFDSPIKICILQRGWVMIGRLERNGDQCKLHDASVIRVWGTTKGLGELAKEGPLSGTKLDKTNGLVEFNDATLIACISVEENVWKNKL